MIHKLSPCWLGILGLCAALSAFAQEKPSDYNTQVPLALSGEGPWYRLELPLTLQLNARQSDLSDVRVFNAAGEPQAYALAREQAQATQSNSLTDVKWFPLYNSADAPEVTPSVRVQSSANGTLVEVSPSGQLPAGEKVLRGWLLDASAIKTPLQQLVLDWSSERDGFQRFSIEASDDLQHWQAWGDGQVARLSFADERVEQHEVALPGLSARYRRGLWSQLRQSSSQRSVGWWSSRQGQRCRRRRPSRSCSGRPAAEARSTAGRRRGCRRWRSTVRGPRPGSWPPG